MCSNNHELVSFWSTGDQERICPECTRINKPVEIKYTDIKRINMKIDDQEIMINDMVNKINKLITKKDDEKEANLNLLWNEIDDIKMTLIQCMNDIRAIKTYIHNKRKIV
jgi:hypothetical protein